MGDNPFPTLSKMQSANHNPTNTRSDLRGSVPVSEPQDFDAIRRQILEHCAYRSATDYEAITVKALRE